VAARAALRAATDGRLPWRFNPRSLPGGAWVRGSVENRGLTLGRGARCFDAPFVRVPIQDGYFESPCGTMRAAAAAVGLPCFCGRTPAAQADAESMQCRA